MKVERIVYSRTFIRQFKKLPKDIVATAIRKEAVFMQNPLHPSLRLHQLHGDLQNIWSISITAGYRILFERMENGDIFFQSIGNHDMYRSL